MLCSLPLQAQILPSHWQATPGSGYSILPQPILHYPLNEGSGTNLTDVSGNGNSGWVKGGTWSTGFIAFNGTSDYGRTSNSITFGTNIITVCFRVTMDAAYDSNVHFTSQLSSDESLNDNSFATYWYLTGGTQYADIQSGTTGTAKYRSEMISGITTQRWTHLAYVFDNSTASGDVKIFKNGVQQGELINLNTKDQAGDFRTDVVWLGSQAGNSYFGKIHLDDYRIYPGELSPTQIRYVYIHIQ